ncbi:class F sortase [Microbacterium lacus]|uniref:class F sortase n=1 Tax=Microbacterium lacus TaxID=415217 RepID=UPI00384BCC51
MAPSPAATAPAPAPTPTIEISTAPAVLPAPAQSVPPVRMKMPDLGVDMPVTSVGVEQSGQMELPVDPAVAGWYRFGADAVSTEGNVVLAAHVDAPDYPIGPLSRLRDAGAGSTVVVEASDGTSVTYAIESVTYYEKSTLPTDQLFAREGAKTLVIITCGGPFDSSTGSYRDNVVAIARTL